MLISSINDNIGFITMNNDVHRNVISTEFINEFIRVLTSFRSAHIRAVVLRANKGAAVWSAGHDVNELPPPGHDPLHWSDALPHLVRLIQSFPAPVIAMVEGTVWGGAVEMAMACDVVVASSNSTFAITPAKLGLPYNINGLSTLSRLIDSHILRELLFSAQPLSAQRLASSGAINHSLPSEELEEFCLNLARNIAKNSPRAISVMKDALRALTARDISVSEFERLEEVRHSVYSSADYSEGLQAFRSRRQPKFGEKSIERTED